MYINGTDMSTLGVYAKKGYSVACAMDRTVYARVGGTGYTASPFRAGLKTIKLPLRIVAASCSEADLIRSRVMGMCTGLRTELRLPNGQQYTSCLAEIGETQKQAEGIIDIDLTFSGYQHGPMIHAVGTAVYCYGTMPGTPARFSSVVAESGFFEICGVTFTGCVVGDAVELDGINCRVLYNGAPCDLSNCNIVSFPALQPGNNILTCDGVLITEYYPMYL